MGVKVFRSTLTWRTLEYQDSVLAPIVPGWPNIPVYTGEEDLPSLLRPTRRKTSDSLYMASLAVLAKNEESFKAHMKALLKAGMKVIAIEDNWNGGKLNVAVKEWKTARRKDHGKHGGEKSAKAKIAATEKGIELIRSDWPKPSKEFPTSELKERSGLSLNTIKKHLGSRPIAQYNYQAAQKRRERRNAKN